MGAGESAQELAAAIDGDDPALRLPLAIPLLGVDKDRLPDRVGGLADLDNANGFEVGVGPSIVVVDEGMAKTTTTNTLKDDIYAFVFGQKGLMAGLGIQGNKISKITPK